VIKLEKELKGKRITLAIGLGFLAFGTCFFLSGFIERMLISRSIDTVMLTIIGIILIVMGSILIANYDNPKIYKR